MNSFLTSINYNEWVLPALLGLPTVGALLVWLHGYVADRTGMPAESRQSAARWITLLTCVLLFVVSIGLWWAFDPKGGWQFVFSVPWVPAWGITFSLALDGISLFLVLLTTFIAAVAAL